MSLVYTFLNAKSLVKFVGNKAQLALGLSKPWLKLFELNIEMSLRALFQT